MEIWAEFAPERVSPQVALTVNDSSFYEDLQQELKEIRLIVIDPATLRDDPLELSFQYTSLADDNHISYDALSYCWGDVYDPHIVHVRGAGNLDTSTKLKVNQNLWSALRHIRHLTEPRTFWIDLLCIDQSNVLERNFQIAIMGDIFASAKNISIWVGDSDDEVRRDFDVIRTLWQPYCPVHMDCAGIISTGQHEKVKAPPCTVNIPDKRETHDILRGIYHWNSDNDRIFRRPWFQRVWVLQEAWTTPRYTVSTQDEPMGRIVVMCGDLQLPWEALVQANYCFNTKFDFVNNAIMPGLVSC